MGLALEGVLVVALEQAVAAPFCTSRLADAGARVIKVERPEGDFARSYDDVADGESAYFVWVNRGKESICLNIKDSRDADLLRRILCEADIFIQNFAPGAAARAGFDANELRQANPRLITVDITGYGASGPYRDMKAYDLLVQCESGLASITGAPDQPGRVGVSVCDIACGMYAHAGILEALIERQRTGLGKGLSVSLFDALADWMTVPLLHQQYTGTAPARMGLNHPSIAPYGAYTCKGGAQLVIAIQNDREWIRFCADVLELQTLAEDAPYLTNIARCMNRAALDDKINSVFSNLTPQELERRLLQAKIAFGAVNSVADLVQHPQLRRTSVVTPSGMVELVAPPVKTSGEQYRLRPVPGLGEHTDSIRREYHSDT
ncbi:CaiB/BaiF CoA transferase family protein [Halioglobus sp. Uisw_031]|jgi:itaconate CoA-transferase|uniref:CaiB/BaiF CoA transferase family protein n=1 Tax=Halioglobus sp. Uisw_031 TaxID=3230977 RepID=UPI0039ECF964